MAETENDESGAGNKQKLKKLIEKAKDEYLAEHAEIVRQYLAEHPEAGTLEVLGHIQRVTASDTVDNGISLNCLFTLFIAVLVIVVLRVQYDMYVEELLLSSMFFSLNPSIDIDLLLRDLPWRIPECTPPHYYSWQDTTTTTTASAESEAWMKRNLEYCDFLAMSINRKLLYLNEYAPHSFAQHSDNSSHGMLQWIMREHFQVHDDDDDDDDADIDPTNDTVSDRMWRYAQDVKLVWDEYIDGMERRYAKKHSIDVESVWRRVGLELAHYVLTTSLLSPHGDGVGDGDVDVDVDIVSDMLDIIRTYLQYEYFRDGFVCVAHSVDSTFRIDFVTIYDLIVRGKIHHYLQSIHSQQMICINTFENVAPSGSDHDAYTEIYIVDLIGKALLQWSALEKQAHKSIRIIDTNEKMLSMIDTFQLSSRSRTQFVPFWNAYDWVKSGGISAQTLKAHDEFIYARVNTANVNVSSSKEDAISAVRHDLHTSSDDAEDTSLLRRFYRNSYLYHCIYFNQFQTAQVDAHQWTQVHTLIEVINAQFGSVVRFAQQMVHYIMDTQFVYYDAGFLWILCDNNLDNVDVYLYLNHTMRMESLSLQNSGNDNDGILLLFDFWSHSFYADFIKGYQQKLQEFEQTKKAKYQSKESVGQSIDVHHIGTSSQKTFGYPRTRMEVFGYYITSLIYNLDWIKILNRFQTQCQGTLQKMQRNHQDRHNNNNEATRRTKTDLRHSEL